MCIFVSLGGHIALFISYISAQKEREEGKKEREKRERREEGGWVGGGD